MDVVKHDATSKVDEYRTPIVIDGQQQTRIG